MLHLGNSRERKQESALSIQCAFRRHLARVRINALYRAHHYKIFDEADQIYLYKNKIKLHMDEISALINQWFPNPSCKIKQGCQQKLNLGIIIIERFE